MHGTPATRCGGLAARSNASSQTISGGCTEQTLRLHIAIGPADALAAFTKEMTALERPRSLLEPDFNLVHYTKMPRGGHFARFEQPNLFVDDVRAFFRTLRT
jgi:pimeloyl-ACP methyl ester carboxylesterase